MEKDLFEIISNIGFPIVITFYILFKLEKKLDFLIMKIDALVTELNNKK